MKLNIVVPVFNEEECLFEFYRRTRIVADPLLFATEWVFINDGGTE
ncbi:MAG: hypothetical protein WC530_04875 [Candidatus Omnitrophota bacterium]|jgi:glycosyltransferase involved in cell wall biosynthesis